WGAFDEAPLRQVQHHVCGAVVYQRRQPPLEALDVARVQRRAERRHDSCAVPLVDLKVHGRSSAYSLNGCTFQMSRAYSITVRSLEKVPMPATLRIAFSDQAAGSRKSRETRCCTSM